MQPRMALDALVSLLVVGELRSVISAGKWAILLEIAQMLADLREPREAMEAAVVAMEEETEAKLATHVEDTDTCRGIVLRVRSATTAVTLGTSVGIVLRRFQVRGFATDARSRVTCRLNAQRLE